MILWDADGVLVDSSALAWSIAEDILGLFGSRVPITSQFDYRKYFGREAQRELVGEDGGQALRALHRLLMRHHNKRVTVHQDVLSVVSRVPTQSVILTSSLSDGIRDVLGPWAKCFAEILGREIASKDQLLVRFAEKKPLFYVTDTITDIARCRAAGIRVCAVTWGYDSREALLAAGPNYTVTSAAELETLIASAK